MQLKYFFLFYYKLVFGAQHGVRKPGSNFR